LHFPATSYTLECICDRLIACYDLENTFDSLTTAFGDLLHDN
jgi:hypothetical protein